MFEIQATYLKFSVCTGPVYVNFFLTIFNSLTPTHHRKYGTKISSSV